MEEGVVMGGNGVERERGGWTSKREEDRNIPLLAGFGMEKRRKSRRKERKNKSLEVFLQFEFLVAQVLS